MMLTWCEADLLMRSGEDMRFADWPAGDFVRMPDGVAKDIPGFTKVEWVPGLVELTEPKWRKA